MFPNRYYPQGYYPGRYFPPTGIIVSVSSGVRRLRYARQARNWRDVKRIDWTLPFNWEPLTPQEKKEARAYRKTGESIQVGPYEVTLLPARESRESEPAIVLKKGTRQGKVSLADIAGIVEEQEIIMLLLIE